MVEFREAEAADAREVAEVHVRSWQIAYRGLLPDAFLDAMRPEERMARYTFGDKRAGQPRTIVAIENRSICGFATCGPAADQEVIGSGEIRALYLDPECWGLGLGRALMSTARQRLTGLGFTEAVLWVLAGNEKARSFYQADGWQTDGMAKPIEIGGAQLDQLRYRRRLGPRR
jgi:GNAT superfamily N-acetyltransferase